MSWRTAYALDDLRNEVNARWPGRSKASDGTIGDAAHASSDSDHNPFVVVGGVGVVRAFDITCAGIDSGWLAQRLFDLARGGDSRLRDNGYIILNRRISNQDWSGWHYYNGSDPHTSHIHLSFGMTGFDNRGGWGVGSAAPGQPAPAPAPAPAPSGVPGLPGWSLPAGHYYGNKSGPNESHGGFYGAEQGAVQAIQRRFIAKGCVPGVSDWRNGWADGLWEDATDEACRNWFNNVDPRPAQQFTDRIYSDDYEVLNR